MTRPRVVLLALSLFLATATFAQSVQYEPLAPTTRDAVTLWISVSWAYFCEPDEVTVDVVDHAITVTVVGTKPQCFQGFPPLLGGWSGKRTIGPLAPGVYTVTVKVINGSTPLIAQQQQLVVRDVRGPFTVVTPDVTPSMKTIHLHSDFGIDCPLSQIPCIFPSVRIGDVPVSSEMYGLHDFTASVPNLPPGTYDVTVKLGSATYMIVAAVNIIDPNLTAFQQARTLERVLVPVVFSGPGAFGSQWTTEVSVVNADIVPLDFYRPPFSDAAGPLNPEQTRTITTAVTGQQPNGLWLYVPRGAAKSLQFSGLIRDLSRQSQTLGTELPIVRESDFFHQTFNLMNVPTDPKYRAALRVYGLGTNEVPIRILAMGGSTTLVQDTLRLALGNNQTADASLTISDLVARYPQLAGAGPLRIEVIRLYDTDFGPSDPGIWGFVSVTNNDTQQVTVITAR